MGITIATAFPGHWKTTYTTTTTINVVNGVGSGISNTTANDSFVAGVNQWGQSGVKIDFYNESKKEIRSVHFEVVPLNNAGIPVSNSVHLQMSGPIKSHAVSRPIWSYLWSDPSINSVQVVRCKVEYADGTSETQSQNSEDNPLIEDHSVSGPLWYPCVLLVLLLAAAFLLFSPFGWLWDSAFGRYSYALVLISVFAAVLFSRLMRNKTATILASVLALASGVYIFYPIILFSIRSFSSETSSYNLGDGIYYLLFAIGCLLFLIVLVLCATGAFASGGKRVSFVLLSEVFLILFLIGAYVLFAPSSAISLIEVLMILLYLGAAILRIRSIY